MMIINLITQIFFDSSNGAEMLGVGLSQWITDLINYNNNFTTALFDNSSVNSLLLFISSLASMLLVVGIIFAIFDAGVNSHEGKSNSVSDLFFNIVKGMAAAACITQIPVLLLKFTNEICNLVCNAFTGNALIEIRYENMSGSTNNFFSGWGAPIFMIIIFICVLKVFLANLKRGGILITLMFIGSIHIFSVPRGYCDAFFSWCKQVLALCITSFMSNVLVVLGAIVYATNSGADVGDLILATGVMLAAAEVPRVAQQFGFDTSIKANVSQAIFAASGITSIMRTII